MEYKITGIQYNSRMCFVCGVENPYGLASRFYETESGEVICRCIPCEQHQSYPGRLHGGVASSLLDETIGRAISVGHPDAIWGITLELSLKYRKPVPYGCPITVVGRVDQDLGRMFTGSGEIILPDGTIAITATGRYLKQPAGKITDPGMEETQLLYLTGEDIPDSIVLPDK